MHTCVCIDSVFDMIITQRWTTDDVRRNEGGMEDITYIHRGGGERERERESRGTIRTDGRRRGRDPPNSHLAQLTQEQPQRWRYEGERFHGQSNLRRPPTPVIDDDGIVHPPIKIHIPPHESIPRAYRHRDAHRQLRLSRYRAICAAREERA